MKKPIITLIVCAALVVGGFFGAKAIINRERTAHAEGMQAKAAQTEVPQTKAPQTEAPQTEATQTEAPQIQQPEKTEIIWYHPSDEDVPELTAELWASMSEQEQREYDNANGRAVDIANLLMAAFEDDAAADTGYPNWFGGCWIGVDNKLHVAFAVDAPEAARAKVRSALSGWEELVVYEKDMPYSYNELYRAIDDVAAHLSEKGVKLTGYGVDTQFNCMNIGVLTGYFDAAEALRAELEALFPYPIVFEEGPYAVLE